MRFIEGGRILANMVAATRYLSGEAPAAPAVKAPFFRAINPLQASELPAEPDVTIDFDSTAIASSAVRGHLIGPEFIAGDAHLLPANERESARAGLLAGLDLIEEVDPTLRYLISQLVATIACYRVPGTDGGSVSSCIGLIFVNPAPHWTRESWAEIVVHEFIHTCMYVEDMVQCVFPDPRLWTHEDAMTTSAIRQTRRPFDKVYHSACVSIGTMYLKHALGLNPDEHLAPLRRSVREMGEADRRMQAAALELLSENGRTILHQMQAFADRPDYAQVRRLIESAATH